jgi:hypothetical protein
MMMRLRNRRSRRGAATVEMAITMLLIVPIFLYALFLDDLLRYQLSQQEAILTTLWDFTNQNYDHPLDPGQPKRDPGSATLLQQNARYMFCDHESGYDRFTQKDGDDYLDCTSEDHHKGSALVAHECWLNGNAHQITCVAPKKDVGASGNGVWEKVRDGQHPNGGMFSCTGNLVVENYLLPKHFMQEFAGDGKDVQLSKENWKGAGGGYHGNAENGTSDTAYYFEPDTFALVADSWAYNKVQSVKPGDKSGSANSPTAFWQDTNTVFTKNLAYLPYMAAAHLFETRLSTQGLVNPAYLFPIYAMGGDDPTKPNLSIKPSKDPSVSVKQDTGSKSYFSSPWKDGSDTYQKTYNARGNNYMGCKSAESC